MAELRVEPSKDTAFLRGDGNYYTWEQMASEIDDEFYPRSRQDFLELLTCFQVDVSA